MGWLDQVLDIVTAPVAPVGAAVDWLVDGWVPGEGDIRQDPDEAAADVRTWVQTVARGRGWAEEDLAAMLSRLDDAMAIADLQAVGGWRSADAVYDAAVKVLESADLARYPGADKLASGLASREGAATKATGWESSAVGTVADAARNTVDDLTPDDPMLALKVAGGVAAAAVVGGILWKVLK